MSTFSKVVFGILLLLAIRYEVGAQTVTDQYISWSPNGNLIAISSVNRIDIRDASSLQLINTIANVQYQQAPVSWNSTSDQIAFARSNLVEVWSNVSIMNGAQLSSSFPTSEVIIGITAWSPDGSKLAYGSDRIEVRDTTNGILLWSAEYPGTVRNIAWNVDNTLLATTSVDVHAGVIIWNAVTGQVLQRMILATNMASASPSEMFLATISVDWSPNNSKLVIGGTDGSVRIWDRNILSEAETYTQWGNPNVVIPHFRDEYGANVQSVDWSPDGNWIASSADDGDVVILNANSLDEVARIQTGIVTSVAWSPNGNQLAYLNSTGIVQYSPAPTLPSTPTPTTTVTPTPTPVLNTIIISDADPIPSPVILSEETRAWYNYDLTLSATLTGGESVTVELDYYPPTPTNYVHVQTRPKRPAGQEVAWTTAQTLTFDSGHLEYEVRIRARDDTTDHTGAVGRLGHHITVSNVTGYPVNTVDASGMRLTGSPFSGGNDASAAADSRNVLVFTVTDND